MIKIFAVGFLAVGLLVSGCGGGGDSSTPAPAATPTPVGPTALQSTDTVVGVGTVATAGSTVTVNYTGWLYAASAANLHGSQFDSSVGKTPFTFKLGAGQVIQGWDLGVVGMKVGGSRTLVIPSSLAYGVNGVAGVIPANTALVFNVDLLAVQ